VIRNCWRVPDAESHPVTRKYGSRSTADRQRILSRRCNGCRRCPPHRRARFCPRSTRLVMPTAPTAYLPPRCWPIRRTQQQSRHRHQFVNCSTSAVWRLRRRYANDERPLGHTLAVASGTRRRKLAAWRAAQCTIYVPADTNWPGAAETVPLRRSRNAARDCAETKSPYRGGRRHTSQHVRLNRE